MAFTLICHACGQKLTLFDLDVKKRKGTIRCTRCGARISYDLDKRNIQQSGFWATEEPAFDPRARNRLMNQLKREEARKAAAEGKEPPVLRMETNPARAHDFDDNPFSAKPGFAKFDLKTGQIIPDGPEKPAPQKPMAPKAPAASPRSRDKEEITFKVVDRSHQKRTIHAAHRALPSMRTAGAGKSEKTFTPPPRIVTRTAHRNMQLVRQAAHRQTAPKTVKISRIQSFWQKVKSFFSFHHS
jgi:DNA-directed RNA polymerase subunit RPC12/RpoP